MCQGDEAADIMSTALDKLNELWIKMWSRRISKEEAIALIEFCHVTEEEEEEATEEEVEEFRKWQVDQEAKKAKKTRRLK